ncbi:hypothetical protein [Geomonas azotofigens]|uniref:hypothetical protein n=1 Tax=Geomonas azotofigens TaxID=2843196 RepID=UPI001C111492|nr:hypothetical protein [Geomonas azotofigens]MBU5612248.1 hypothetical protein [Geomonas azotofigens]
MKKIWMSLGLLLLTTVLSGCCPCWWHDRDDGNYRHDGRHYDDRGGYGDRRY